MKILFDQGTPVPLRRLLPDHTVRTAFQEGWSAIANGDLIRTAEEAGFDLILTTDKNMRYQQNLSGRRIAILLLGQQQWPALQPHVKQVIDAIQETKPGSFTEVAIP